MREDDNTLRIAVRAFGPFETALEKVWTEYCHKTGCTLTLDAVPMDLHDLHDSILEQEGLKRGDWDIAFMNTDWIAEAFARDALEDLTPCIEQNSPDDFPAGWSDSLLNMQVFDEAIYGLPYHDGPECLIYRKDLFEDTEERQRYRQAFDKELGVPATWDEFQQIARFFQRPDENLYGTVFAAYPDGHNTVFDFCLQLWTRGGDLINRQGEIDIDAGAAVEGLTFYRKILNDSSAIHPRCGDFDSVKSGEAFAKGEVAMMVNWFGFALMSEFLDDSRTKGKVDVAPVPHGPAGASASLNAYWLYTIGSGSAKKEQAYDFIKFAVSPANDKLLTIEGGTGCRKSTWGDEEVNATVPYYHRLDELHENARELPRRRDWAQIAAVIDEIVLETINSDRPIGTIVADGKKKINEITAS